MKATLVFDIVNNLIFFKWDNKFIERMTSFGEKNVEEKITDTYNVSQLLSPIITSQRVMAAQFGNTYSSMQCKDGTTIVFDEWLDHVFMIISEEMINDAQRELMDCKTLVQHICGQNIKLLQSPIYQEWLSVLLESRTKGDSIPGVSGVIGESGATATALNALKTISKDIKFPHSHYHLMLYVGDKQLALYSSRGSEDLTPPDIILLSIECIAAQEYWSTITDDNAKIIRIPWLSQENSAIVNLCPAAANYPCVPYSMHLSEVAPRVTLVILVDMELRDIGITTSMSNQQLSNLKRLLLQRSLELIPGTLDSLEVSLKRTTDALRKLKSSSSLVPRITSKMVDLRKSCTTTTPLTPETAAASLSAVLDTAIEFLKPDIPSLKIEPSLIDLRVALSPYVEFLRIKALRFFGMGSGPMDASSLTLHKYVQEFPGLIHFVYIDRSAGRFIAPDLADCIDLLPRNCLKHIVSRSLAAYREGYCAGTWRRGAHHVCSLLWWERRGAAVSPAAPPHPAAVRAACPPGDILAAFYRQLTELAFPDDSQGVSIKELICIHLGLLPASTAVQQARRLAHSVLELAGDNPAVAAELL